MVEYKKYTNPSGSIHLDVRIVDGAVWLTRQQMAELYGRDVKTIGKHVNNVLAEMATVAKNAPVVAPVVAKFAIVANDGKSYQVEHYSMACIVEVAARVKSVDIEDFQLWTESLTADIEAMEVVDTEEVASANSPAVVYASEDGEVRLNVIVEDETVWLTQAQMAELFQSSRANISEHLKNIYEQKELEAGATIRKFRTVQTEGGRKVSRELDIYNLDVIISVGFRVNTSRGIAFRRWANSVLKQYMLRGYAFAQRFERIEHRLANVEEKHELLALEVHGSLPPNEGVFYEGQVFDARVFVERLVRSAQREIILIDAYVDSDTIAILNERSAEVQATIYTDKMGRALQQAEDLSEQQTGRKVELKKYRTNFHDRFLIIDDDLYHFGASLKDLGKRLFAFDKMAIDKQLIINQL